MRSSLPQSYIGKKGRWGGVGGSQPLHRDHSNVSDDSEVSGGFLIPPHSSYASEAHLRGSTLGHLSRGNSAQPTEPLNSAGPLPATFKPFPPAAYSDMMSFLLRQD